MFRRLPAHENAKPIKTIFVDLNIKTNWSHKIAYHLFSRKSGIERAKRISPE